MVVPAAREQTRHNIRDGTPLSVWASPATPSSRISKQSQPLPASDPKTPYRAPAPHQFNEQTAMTAGLSRGCVFMFSDNGLLPARPGRCLAAAARDRDLYLR